MSAHTTSENRHALALLTFLPVSGTSAPLPGRARSLPTLQPRTRRAWTLLRPALLANWLGGSLYADLAMFQAKTRGKGRRALFDPELNAAAAERLGLETALLFGSADSVLPVGVG